MRFAAFLLALPLMAADATPFSGIWVGRLPTRNGEFQDIAFQLKQHGTVLSGKLYGDYRSSRIVEGKVDGTTAEFVIDVDEQAGNQINTTRWRYTAKLDGEGLELVRARERASDAGNGGVVQLRGGTTVTLRLRKLL
jgi:hypothetical protein